MGFLQIPPHDGHPCPWLTVPTAKSVADFHRQVIAHAERTVIAAVFAFSVNTAAILKNTGIYSERVTYEIRTATLPRSFRLPSETKKLVLLDFPFGLLTVYP